MNTMIKVARYHLVRPLLFVGLPWATLAVAFAADAARGDGTFHAGVFVLFIMFFVTGVQRIGGWLPFGLALGATRRSFYAGTALLGVSMSLVSGLVIAGLQAIERATGGWGLSITFFRVPHLMNGPWYDTWLTAFVLLSALFVYGMWYGIVNQRWGILGLIAFMAAQVVAALAVRVAYGWSGIGGHLASLGPLNQTCDIAVLAVVFLAGGHATIRRITV